jgi:hypothetical protein
MKQQWMIFTVLITLSLPSWSSTSQAVLEERLYFDFQKVILEKSLEQKGMNGFSAFEQGLYVDALWDLAEENSPEALDTLDKVQTFHYNIYEKLRIGLLRLKYNQAVSLPAELVSEIENSLREPKAELRLIYIIAAYETELVQAGHSELVTVAKTHPEYMDIAADTERKEELTTDIVADIFHRTPDVSTYMNGEYVKSVKIFIFCRSNRIYPCLLTMRDAHGEVVRNEDGSLWTHKALASSKQGLPSYTRNGNTPAGIFTIDSVMPTADQQMSFGKFRRMILNFVPKSKNETLLRSLLPRTSHDADWWKATVTARDGGRNLFRIHGTLKINTDPTVPYFPFMRTSGCIAQRENTYEDVTYSDQRLLLDKIMMALNLAPVYANEPKVKGILYIVEINDTDEAVTEDDLRTYGIE